LIGSAGGAENPGDTAAQANNSLANMTALNFQDYYIGRLAETDEDGNQFWLRFAKPFSVAKTDWFMADLRWREYAIRPIARISGPSATRPSPPESTSGKPGRKNSGLTEIVFPTT